MKSPSINLSAAVRRAVLAPFKRRLRACRIPMAALALALSGPLTSAWAASYYVDFTSGSDTRTGTSKETAWKRCPGDEAATGVAATTALKPGDIVHFKGGVAYLGGITLSASGLSGQEIILDGNHSGSWGTGRAVIDRNYEVKSCITGKALASHWIVRGFELRNAGGYADNDPILSTTEPLINKPPGGGGSVSDRGRKRKHIAGKPVCSPNRPMAEPTAL